MQRRGQTGVTSAGVFLTSSVLRRGLRVRPIKVRERVDHGLSVVQDVDEAQAESCPAESGLSVSRDTGVSSTRTRGPYGLEVRNPAVPYATVFMWSGWPRAGTGRPEQLSRIISAVPGGLCRRVRSTLDAGPRSRTLSDAGDEIVGSLCVIVSIITSIGRQSYVVVKSPPDPTLQSSRSWSNGFDACGYDPTRGRGASRTAAQSAPLNPRRSIVRTAGSHLSSRLRSPTDLRVSLPFPTR